jgi:hypothetical protein
MAKKTMLETDEARLKKKVGERRHKIENSGADAALRGLSKRLKRLQRKRRALALRKRHAAGKAAGTDTKAETPPAS